MGLSQLGVFSAITLVTEAAGIFAVVTARVGNKDSRQTLSAAVDMSVVVNDAGLTSLVLAAGFSLEGETGDWENPMDMGSGVAIKMPIDGVFGFTLLPAPPYILPSVLGFAGGIRIGDSSAYVAILFDLEDPTTNAFSIALQDVSIVSIMKALCPVKPSPFSAADTILSQLLVADSATLSMNPSPFAVAVGPAAMPYYIPGGLQISIVNLWLFDVINIESAYLQIMPTKGIAMGVTMGPLDFIGLFTINCGSCATPKSVGPSFAFSLTPSDRSCTINGGVSLFAGKPPFGQSIVPKRDMPRTIDFIVAVSFEDTAFSIEASPSAKNLADYVTMGLEVSGDMADPLQADVAFSFSLTEEVLAPVSAGVMDAVQDVLDFVRNIVSASDINVRQADKAFATAQAALAAATGGIQAQFDAQQRKVNDKQGECDSLNGRMEDAKGKCSWKSPQQCVLKVSYAAAAGGCYAVLDGYKVRAERPIIPMPPRPWGGGGGNIGSYLPRHPPPHAHKTPPPAGCS